MASEGRIQKSYFDVLGLCCSSEVPLIEKILKPLDGILKVTVSVPSKTVIVVHDELQISQLQIVKALNQARLEASIRSFGTDKIINKWPSPYILACGLLLVISLFQRFFRPLQWLAIAAVVAGIPQIILRSIAAIRRCTLDINILMLVAVGGAVALRDYSEAGFIVFLFTLSEWLESLASHKATIGMSSLMSMVPQKAMLAETGVVVDAKDIKVDTIIAVRAGEVIPVDGIVVEGRSEVDEKSLTGESFPVAKEPQSLVFAGTLNIDGYISVKTTALADNSAISKMARLVEEAQNSRSRTQRLIDSCAKYYTPVVVVISAGVAVVPVIMRAHNQKHWFQFALVLLVSSCPCALVLSTPVVTFCALLKAARAGLFVKGGDVFEVLATTKVVAFDKTGTITRGDFSVTEFRSLSCRVSTDMLLSWISSIERKSSHPMASALVEHARFNAIEPKPEQVIDFNIHPGEGVSGEINGNKIYIGNKRIAARAGCVEVPNLEDMNDAVTVGYIFLGTEPVGAFSLSDTCRTGAREGIKELKSLGIKTVILTGDNTAAAMHASKQLGDVIEEIHAELLPEDKVRLISDLKSKNGSTVMVGDGMNDAPALAMADVGISMGVSGSAVAVEISHVTLLSNDIRKIPKAIRLARRAKLKIVTNIFFSIFTKMAIIGLAIGGHPLLWAAVLGDVGTCLVVILNSMMLLSTWERKEKRCCQRAIPAIQSRPCSDVCTKDSCASSASRCGQPKFESCRSNQGCCKNEKKEEDMMPHGCCQSARDERRALRPESPAQCSAGKVECQGNVGSPGRCKNERRDKDVRRDCCTSACGELGLRLDSPTRCRTVPVKCSKRNDGCASPSGCDEPKSESCHSSLGCCKTEEKEEDVQPDCCMSACEERDLWLRSGSPPTQCCAGLVNRSRGNDSCAHLIAKPCEEHQSKQSTYEHSGQPRRCSLGLNAGEHCFSPCGDHAPRTPDAFKASQVCRGLDKKSSGKCCENERQGCQGNRECTDLSACSNKMEVGSCCRSYMKDYWRTDACCGSGMMQIPEIIIE